VGIVLTTDGARLISLAGFHGDVGKEKLTALVAILKRVDGGDGSKINPQ
jgi:hypothetical protein